MTLRTALVLSGDEAGAKRALEGVDQALVKTKASADALSTTNDKLARSCEDVARSRAQSDEAVQSEQAALDRFTASMVVSEAQQDRLIASAARLDRTVADLASAQALAKTAIDANRAALDRGEISLEQYYEAVLTAKGGLSLLESEHRDALKAFNSTFRELDQGGKSIDRSKAGYEALGNEVQDIASMMLRGGNIGDIISSQGLQVADAVSQMGGRFSGLAAFLAGPWGAAVFVAVSVLTELVASLWETADAAELATSASDGLSNAQGVLGQMFDLTTGKIKNQNDMLRLNAQLMLTNLKMERDTARSAARGTASEYRAAAYYGAGGRGEAGNVDTVASRIIEDVLSGKISGSQGYERAERLNYRNSPISRTDTLNAIVKAAEFGAKSETIAAVEKSLKEGALDPGLRNPPTGSNRPNGGGPNRGGSSGMDQAAKDAKDLADFAKEAARSIDQINQRFGEQPGLLQQGRDGVAELDALIAELGLREPPDFKKTIESANAAKDVIAEAMIRPFTELREESERRQEIDQLILSGREAEAAVLQEIWRIEERLGPLNAEQRAEVEAIVLAEEEHLRQLEKAQQVQSAYLSTTQSVRSELEAIFAGRGDFGNFKRIYRDLQAKILVEQIFGPAFDEFDKYVKENTALEEAVDSFAGKTGRAGDAAATLADAFLRQASRIDGGAGAAPQSEFDRAFAGFGNPEGDQFGNGPIVVTATREEVRDGIEDSNSVMGLTPERYFEELTKRLVSPLLEKLDEEFGTQFFSQLQGAVAGALYGSATAGTTGGILGGLKGLVDGFGEEVLGPEFSKGLSDALGKGLGGAQTGTQIAGLAGMFGIDLSNTGAQLGGAAGAFLPIPGGDIIGALAGGIIGKLISGSKRGSAIVTGADNELGSYGNNSSRKDAAQGLGGAVQEGLRNIAELLDADIGSFLVSIGIRNDSFRVDTQGRGYTKSSLAGVKDFGSDEGAAIAYAMADAIADGAIIGISEKMQAALRSRGDVEKAVEEALLVRELEFVLGGIGGEMERAFRDFERQAKERLRVAREYGFDIVEVEELNARERLALSERLLAEQVGSLQDLIDDMTSGGLFEGSAVDRREQLLAAIAEARTDVAAGEDGAADRLADLFRQLNSVSEEVFGTTGGFATDRSSILDEARSVIAAANERISQAQTASDPALAETNAALDENNDQNARMIALLEELSQGGGLPPGFGGEPGFGGSGLAGFVRSY